MWEAWRPGLAALPRSSAHRRLGDSFPSVFFTIRHMVHAEVIGSIASRADRRHVGSPGTTMTRLESTWRALRERRLVWLGKAAPDHAVEFEASGGFIATVSVWQCLFHVLTHAHFHRGQLVTQLRQLGIRPPSRHLLGPSTSMNASAGEHATDYSEHDGR